MASEHLSAQQVERYRQRALSAAELLSADDHLATCEECRQRLAEVESLQAAFASLRSDFQADAELDHLAYEQLAAYVDDTLDEVDREIVESHLELCPPCAAEMKDLRAFRAAMTTYPAREYAPVTPPTLWEKFLTFWRLPTHWIPMQVAGTAAVAALFVWIAARPLTTRIDELEQTNAALRKKQDPRVAQLTIQLREEQQRSQQEQERAERIQQEKQRSEQENQTLQKRNAQLLARLQQPSVPPTSDSSRVAGDLKKLIGKSGTLMGSSDEGFVLLSPVGTFAQSDRPTFIWEPLKGATGYEVTVFDSEGKVVASGTLQPDGGSQTKIQWQIPSAHPPLKRGSAYRWEVVATLQDGKEVKSPPPARPDAQFKVLGQKQMTELTAKRKNVKSPLGVAKLYIEFGLLDDAERELQTFRHRPSPTTTNPAQ